MFKIHHNSNSTETNDSDFYLVDGGYTEWGTWGSCSKTCEDAAIRVRERNCTNPVPSCGGDDCVPETKNGTTVDLDETESCNQGVPCPGAYFYISFIGSLHKKMFLTILSC